MEYTHIPGIDKKASRIGMGGWPIGGFMWGGNDDKEASRMIHAALDQKVTVLDTANDYGFGHSEKLIGQALKESGKTLSFPLKAH